LDFEYGFSSTKKWLPDNGTVRIANGADRIEVSMLFLSTYRAAPLSLTSKSEMVESMEMIEPGKFMESERMEGFNGHATNRK
jgi:hypothetical protein